MQKKIVLQKITESVENELNDLKKAYDATKDLVQSGDIKNEGKYDTRATEANYLADGQRHRIYDLEHDLELLNEVDLNHTDGTVSIGSLVDFEHNGLTKRYFIAPTAGGTMVEVDGEAILVISVFSPLGDTSLGLEVGESFELEINGSTREYSIKYIE